MSPAQPSRGDVWTVDLDPTRGREQAGMCPALLVSVDAFNRGPAQLVIALPMTSRDRRIRSHVPVAPSEGGLTLQSFIKCEDVRSVPKERLVRRLGAVSPATIAAVEHWLRIVLGL